MVSVRSENDEAEHLESIEPDDVFDEPETDPAQARSKALFARTQPLDSKTGITVRPAAPGVTPEPMVLDLPQDAYFDSDGTTGSHESGMGLSWDYVRRTSPTSLGLRLRALAECLSALGALHTDLQSSPDKRVHGAVWYGNLMIRQNGSALLLRGENLTPQPSAYAAPELKQRRPDQQADVYAVGVMLLEALCEQPLHAREISELAGADLSTHPFWARLADDPLLWVALRAIARDPGRRWPSAREFADALIQCSFDKMVSKQQLGGLIELVLAEQADRATPLFGQSLAGDAACDSQGVTEFPLEQAHTVGHDREAIAPEPEAHPWARASAVPTLGGSPPRGTVPHGTAPHGMVRAERAFARTALWGSGLAAALAACVLGYALFMSPSAPGPVGGSPQFAAEPEPSVAPAPSEPTQDLPVPNDDPGAVLTSEPEPSIQPPGAETVAPVPSASGSAKPTSPIRPRPALRNPSELLPEAVQRPASSKPTSPSRYEPEGI